MWKANWSDTRERFTRWWQQEGLLIGMWGAPEVGRTVQGATVPLSPAVDLKQRYCDPEWRAQWNHNRLARSIFPLDVLPMAEVDLGPGSFASYCGSKPDFAEDTVWFHPAWDEDEEVGDLPPIRFDPESHWWRVTEALIDAAVKQAGKDYIVGCPDLVENLDTLSSLRGAETLMMDLIEEPEWVEARLDELNAAWFEVYQRTYDKIRQPDGGSAFCAFYLWGPGKTAKVQCDASAMLSNEMYHRFVLPRLREQCAWLDYSLYHLDGTQAMGHLDSILSIESLNAIEWTPQAGIEGGGRSPLARTLPAYSRGWKVGSGRQRRARTDPSLA